MRWFSNNGLTLVLMAIFVLTLVGQALTGLACENEQRHEHGLPAQALPAYLGSGSFQSSVFENWESEFLEKAAYVVFTAVLIQRGSAESRDPDSTEDPDAASMAETPEAAKPWPVRLGAPRWVRAIFENSLGLALMILFILSFVLHWVNSARAKNADALMHGQPQESWWAHLGSAELWFQSFQNWQSEFLSTAALVVLSIWLRQKGSPESKPLAAPHSSTGR